MPGSEDGVPVGVNTLTVSDGVPVGVNTLSGSDDGVTVIADEKQNRYSVVNVSPYPKVMIDENVIGQRRKRKAEVSSVLTSSPYKTELIEKLNGKPRLTPKASKSVQPVVNKKGKTRMPKSVSLSQVSVVKNLDVCLAYR